MKNVLITGATKGIGKAIAVKFAAHNYNLAICSRNKDEVTSLAQELSSTHNIKVFAMEVDVCDTELLERFADESIKTLGSIDILVNNAGVFIPGMVHTEAEGTLDKMMETNLYSAYYLSRAIIPQMIEQKSGHIFNMCSTASISAYINGGSYCISKFAMYGMSKVLREELKDKGIKVTSILPGATFTASWEGTELPEERFLNAEDVADSVFQCTQLSNSAVVEDLIIRPQLGDI